MGKQGPDQLHVAGVAHDDLRGPQLGQRLGSAFGNGMRNFVDNMEDLVVFVAYNWIGILIWIAVIAVVVVVVRRKTRRIRLPKLGRKTVEKTDDKQDET